jgi:hypothetical protein
MAKVSLLARAGTVRATVTPRTSSTSFAAVDVAGGGRRISAFVPRRDLTGDASSNGVDHAVHGGDSTAAGNQLFFLYTLQVLSCFGSESFQIMRGKIPRSFAIR